MSKSQPVVDLVGLLLAQVPRHPRSAQHRAGKAERLGALRRNHADADRALLPDAVVGEQRLVLVHALGEALREVVDEIQHRALAVGVQPRDVFAAADARLLVLRHALGQVAIDPARAVVGGVHARAGHRLVAVHQVLALAEAVQEHGHRADVERVRAEPQQMIEDAGDLVEHAPGCTAPAAAPRCRAASRSPGSRRARCTSWTRSRAGPCRAAPACRSCARPASRWPGAAARCAGRRAGSPRRRARAPAAAPRAPPDAGARSSSCSF